MNRLFAVCLFSVPLLLGQTPVRTDLVVRDGRGRMVRNLEPGDVTLTEDGAKANIKELRFEGASKPEGPRLLVFLFDDLAGEMARFSRDGAGAVLSAKSPDTQWAVFRVGNRVEALQGFTADLKAVRAAIDRATGRKTTPGLAPETASLPFSNQSILRAAARLERGQRARPATAALIALSTELGRVAGRKAIVYFSLGNGIGGPQEDAFRAIVSAANQAGVAIYTVDASGLATSAEVAHAREAMMFQIQGFGMRDVNESGMLLSGLGRQVNIAHAEGGTPTSSNRPVDRGPLPPLRHLAESTGGFIVSQSNNYRGPLKQIAEELSGYYTLTYTPADTRVDGRFRAVKVEVSRSRSRIQQRRGYYAAPVVPGTSALAFELPLMERLKGAPVADFPYTAAIGQFRDAKAEKPLTTISLEVQGKNVEFVEEPGGGLYRGHISALALIRGKDGAVLDKFGGDTPVQCPPRLLPEMKERYFVFEEQFELAPGDYTLETAVQDRTGNRFSTSRRAFRVEPAAKEFALGSVTLVRHITTADENLGDSPFLSDGKRIIPALDGHVDGGKGARASLFLRLYPDPSRAPVQVEIRGTLNGKPALQSKLSLEAGAGPSLARLVSLGIGNLAPGRYDLEVTATSAGKRVSQQLPLIIDKGVNIFAHTEAAQTEAKVESVAGISTTPPNAEQQQLLEDARHTAVQYAQKLPNFLCTQVTRRMVDTVANGRWQTTEETAQLLTYYDGQEHYHSLTTAAKQTEDRLPAMTSSGEFGSLLKQIFRPEAKAKFAFARRESIRGRAVQVYTYDVDAKNGQYRVGYNGAQTNAPVWTGFHGMVFVDEQTAAILRVTHETETLPEGFPVRQFALSIDYDDISVGGISYVLPVGATLNLRLRKKTLIRNEVSFRAYQRFTTESRVLSFDPQPPKP